MADALTFKQSSATEFIMGIEMGDPLPTYFRVPVDTIIQGVLMDILRNTQEVFVGLEDSVPCYEPAEKFSSSEPLRLPLSDSLCDGLREVFTTGGFADSPTAIDDFENLSSYGAVFTDENGERVISLKKATYFKQLLKKRNFLIRAGGDDSLKSVEDKIFKLDKDFDIIIDADTAYILHPSNFEYLAGAKERILEKAEENTRELSNVLPFLAVDRLAAYVATRPRAARLVASLRSRDDLHLTSKELLSTLCRATGVELEDNDGFIEPSEKHEMEFLNVLDRRRYLVELIKETPEIYEAPSRHRA